MAGHPELSDWRLCENDLEKQKKLSYSFHESFKLFH